MHNSFATTSQSHGNSVLQSFVYYLTPIQFTDLYFWKGKVRYLVTMLNTCSMLEMLGSYI